MNVYSFFLRAAVARKLMDPSFLANLKHYSSFKVELLAAVLGLCYIIENDNNYHKIFIKKNKLRLCLFLIIKGIYCTYMLYNRKR